MSQRPPWSTHSKCQVSPDYRAKSLLPVHSILRRVGLMSFTVIAPSQECHQNMFQTCVPKGCELPEDRISNIFLSLRLFHGTW